MRKTLALIAVLCTPPLLAGAQSYAPPGYTFGGFGNGMPGGFPFGFPGGFPGGFANNYAGAPPAGFAGSGFPGGNRGVFLTMPNVPSNTASGPAPNTTRGTTPGAVSMSAMQPTPYWMQTPPSPQSQQPARYINDVPGTAPVAVLSSAGPARWAPLPGQAPVVISGNNWALPRVLQRSALAPTRPRWATP